jgi:hypothetical protein
VPSTAKRFVIVFGDKKAPTPWRLERFNIKETQIPPPNNQEILLLVIFLLAIIAIESETLEKIDYGNIIKDFIFKNNFFSNKDYVTAL